MNSTFERILNESCGISKERLNVRDSIENFNALKKRRLSYPSFIHKQVKRRKSHFYSGMAIGDVNARLLALENKLPICDDRNNNLFDKDRQNCGLKCSPGLCPTRENDSDKAICHSEMLIKVIEDMQFLQAQEHILNLEFEHLQVVLLALKKKKNKTVDIYQTFRKKKLLDVFPTTENEEWELIQKITEGISVLIKNSQKFDKWKLLHPSSQSQSLQKVFNQLPSVLIGNVLATRPEKIIFRSMVKHVLGSISIIELMSMLNRFRENSADLIGKKIDITTFLIDTFRDWLVATIERLCKKATDYMVHRMSLDNQYMLFLTWFLTIGLIPYDPTEHTYGQFWDQCYDSAVEKNSTSALIWNKINSYLDGTNHFLNYPNTIVPMDDCIIIKNQTIKDQSHPMYKALRLSTKKEIPLFIPSINHLINGHHGLSMSSNDGAQGCVTICGRMLPLISLCEEMKDLHRKATLYNACPRVAFSKKKPDDTEKEELLNRENMRREDSMKEEIQDLKDKVKEQNIEMSSLETMGKENDQMMGEILALVESEQSITQADVRRVLKYSLASRSGSLSSALKSIDELLSDTDVKSIENYQLKCGIAKNTGSSEKDETRTYQGELHGLLSGNTNIDASNDGFNLKKLEIQSAMDLFKSRQAMAFNLDGNRLQAVKERMKQLEENRLATKQELEKWPTLFNLVTDLLMNEKTRTKLLRDSISKAVGTVNHLKAENLALSENFSELKNLYESQLDLQQQLMSNIESRLDVNLSSKKTLDDTSMLRKDLLSNIISLLKKTKSLKSKIRIAVSSSKDYLAELNECSIDFYKDKHFPVNGSYDRNESSVLVTDVSSYKSLESLALIDHNFSPQIPDLKFYEDRLQEAWQSVISEFLQFLPEVTFCNKIVRYVETESTLCILFKPFFDLLVREKKVDIFSVDISPVMVQERDGSNVKRAPTSVDEFLMTTCMFRTAQIGIYLDFMKKYACSLKEKEADRNLIEDESYPSLFDQSKRALFVQTNPQNMDPASVSALKS